MDLVVDLLDSVSLTVDEGGAGVDDSVEARGDLLVVDNGTCASALPVAAAGDGVILDVTSVGTVVGASEVEGRALGGELEGEAVVGDNTLGVSVLEEWSLKESGVRTKKTSGTDCETDRVQLGNVLESHAEETISRVGALLELGGQGSDGRESLSLGSHTSNSDYKFIRMKFKCLQGESAYQCQ